MPGKTLTQAITDKEIKSVEHGCSAGKQIAHITGAAGFRLTKHQQHNARKGDSGTSKEVLWNLFLKTSAETGTTVKIVRFVNRFVLAIAVFVTLRLNKIISPEKNTPARRSCPISRLLKPFRSFRARKYSIGRAKSIR